LPRDLSLVCLSAMVTNTKVTDVTISPHAVFIFLAALPLMRQSSIFPHNPPLPPLPSILPAPSPPNPLFFPSSSASGAPRQSPCTTSRRSTWLSPCYAYSSSPDRTTRTPPPPDRTPPSPLSSSAPPFCLFSTSSTTASYTHNAHSAARWHRPATSHV
jgi:hypothetical protein